MRLGREDQKRSLEKGINGREREEMSFRFDIAIQSDFRTNV